MIGQEIVTVDNANYFEVSNNWIHDNYHFESINIKDGASNGKIHHNNIKPIESAGIYVDAWNKSEQNNEIYNNIIHDGGNGVRGIALSVENGGSLTYVKVYNNIIYNMGFFGAGIASYSNGVIDNIDFVNNTIYYCGFADNGWGGGGIKIEYTNATNIRIRNNICYANVAMGDLSYANGSGSLLDNNLTGTNPLFVSTSIPDFHLQPSSPAIDTGSSTPFVPGFDFDSKTRPQGQGYDIGAYEYISDGGCPPFVCGLSVS